ncbi:MAG: porin [Pseudomonadota bacterium]
MKFTIAALLIVACLPAPALAQNSVTFYGIVDLGVVADRDSGQSSTRVDSGNQTASRLGFTGEHDLGGGLKASFMIESQIEADTGASSFSGRPFGSQTWVGLSGRFGSLKAGRMFTPYFGAIATNDPFDAKGPGESTRVFQDSGVRMDNTVKYSLPSGLHGFYGDLAYGAGEVSGNSAALRQISMDAGYRAGPLNLQLAYHNSNDAAGALAVRSTMVGANYDFGRLRGWMILAQNRNDTTLDTRDSLIGISLPVHGGTLAADYVRKSDRMLSDANATQVALGFYHTLSKRTNVYLVGSRLRNGSMARYQTTLLGGTRQLLSLGVRHQF